MKKMIALLLAMVMMLGCLQAVAEEKDPALTASKSFVDESLMTDRTNYYNFLKTILPAIELEEKRMEDKRRREG